MTPESLRVKQWRESNKDRYNANQKALMKARRAKKKDGSKKIEPENKVGFSITTIPYKP